MVSNIQEVILMCDSAHGSTVAVDSTYTAGWDGSDDWTKPSNYSSVGVLGTYPFFDPCRVAKLLGQVSTIELVCGSIATRHQ